MIRRVVVLTVLALVATGCEMVAGNQYTPTATGSVLGATPTAELKNTLVSSCAGDGGCLADFLTSLYVTDPAAVTDAGGDLLIQHLIARGRDGSLAPVLTSASAGQCLHVSTSGTPTIVAAGSPGCGTG